MTEENYNYIAYVDLNISNIQLDIHRGRYVPETTAAVALDKNSCHPGEHLEVCFLRLHNLPQ
jgi:hypothetical protein